MHMRPVVVPKSIDLLQLVMGRKVKDFLDLKAYVVLILQKIDLLLVVHDEQRLFHLLSCVVLDALTISL